MAYVNTPLETDPDAIAQEAFDYIQARFSNWTPADGNLDTILIEAWGQAISELREIETDVRDQIFRSLGATLHGVLPIDASSATVTSTWTATDDLGYTIPAGAQVAIPATGDEYVGFEVVSQVVIAPGSTVTAAGGVTLSAIEPGEDGSGLTGTPQIVDALSWVSSVALVGATSGGVDAESDDDYLVRLVNELRLLSPAPILPEDFAVLAKRVAGVERAVAVDLYNPNHNWLTLNQASLEVDTTGWASNANCTITRSTTQAADGTASLRLDATAAGDMSAITPTGASGEPVTAGDQYTAVGSFRSAVTVQSCRVSIRWYTSGGATISTTDGSTVADTTTGFTQASVTATAPATAAFAAVIVTVLSADATNEFHYADKIAFRRGASTVWAAGDIDDENNERMVTVVGVDENGDALSPSTKTEIEETLEELREINFVVHVIDPTFSVATVTFSAVALPGHDAATVEAAAETAILDYLDPAAWGIETTGEEATWLNRTTVRYGELYAVLNSVAGLDYVTALTINGAADTDLVLAGIVPLPDPASTATGTVTAP